MVGDIENSNNYINCPYCGERIGIIENTENKIIYVQPNGTYDLFTIDLLKRHCPNIILNSLKIKCSTCEHIFQVQIINNHISSVIKPYCNYHIDLLSGKVKQPIIKKPIIEQFYDGMMNLFERIGNLLSKANNKMPDYNEKETRSPFLGSMAISIVILTIISLISAFTHKYQMLYDWQTYFVLVLNTVLLWFIIRLIKKIRNSIDSEIPYKLDKSYLKSNSFLFLKEKMKASIFGYPYKINIISYLLGGLLLISGLQLLFSKPITILNVISVVIAIYSIFLVGMAMILYIKSMLEVDVIALYIPLKINPFKKAGGIGTLGELISFSWGLICVMIIFFTMMLVYGITNGNINTQNIINNLSINNISINAFMPLTFLLLPTLLIFWLIIPGPIYELHKRLTEYKEDKLDEISSSINPDNISENDIEGIHELYQLRLFDEIKKMSEWPFEGNLLNYLKDITILIIIPLAGLLIAIYQLMLMLKNS